MQMLTSRRITLTFALDTCYPLSVMYDKAVILGVTSERVSGCGPFCPSFDLRSLAVAVSEHYKRSQ